MLRAISVDCYFDNLISVLRLILGNLHQIQIRIAEINRAYIPHRPGLDAGPFNDRDLVFVEAVDHLL